MKNNPLLPLDVIVAESIWFPFIWVAQPDCLGVASSWVMQPSFAESAILLHFISQFRVAKAIDEDTGLQVHQMDWKYINPSSINTIAISVAKPVL